MIYLVTKQTQLFESDSYQIITEEDALKMMQDWGIIQYDSETSGRDARLCDILCIQFGNDTADTRIVVDATTINIMLFKETLESKLLIGHNLKFDLQFLYNYGIIPRKVYDTMIVEQLLYLGFPAGIMSYSLKSVAWKYLKEDIDKTVRGEIIWRGLDESVVIYAAGDVTFLERIMMAQVNECNVKHCLKAAQLECNFVPSIAYMEWCGIMLDQNKWKEKMANDERLLHEAEEKLNDYVVSKSFQGPDGQFYTKKDGKIIPYPFVEVNLQGDLWEGFDDKPHCNIKWGTAKTMKYIQFLGFDTEVTDKKTGESKDSILEKVIKTQKGIDDTFLKLYFEYQEHRKVCTTYGQGHLDAVNPKTGRIHTVFRQLGTASGRLSCGSNQQNTDLAKYKGISSIKCTYPNLQQLPADEPTRSSFIAPEGNLMVSADFSAEESRLAADIYQDKEFYKEFTEGSGDTHSLFAWVVFRKECEECGCTGVQDVKKKAPQWRKAVKAVEFAYLFGAAAPTISKAADCSVEQAQAYLDALDKGFVGVSSFAKKGSKFVREHGYILISPVTGHKMYWWDWDKWVERGKHFTQEFWDEYRAKHKGTGDEVARAVREHFQAAGKYDRMARNTPTQGTGACIMKHAMTQLFNWIVDNNYFDKVHICCSVHDEIVCDFPKELSEFPNTLETIMESSAAVFCKSLPIPAEASVGTHWIH